MADTAGARMGAIYYEVDADTQKLIDGLDQAEKSLDRLKKSMSRIDGAAPRVEFQLDRVSAAARNMGRESGVAASSIGDLTRVIGGLLTLQGANALIQMAEGYNEMAERVRMATGSQEEFEMVQQRLLKTANGTYRAMSEAQEVYIRTADSLRSMGYSTEQALDITDSLSYAFVTNAASADRASGAISAYSKSINKGKVDAQSWETIIAAVPSIINDIATASGKSADAIRELGASGQITAQMLNEGLRQSLDANKAAADGMATTVRDAFINLRNSLAVYLNEANQATGATTNLSKSIVLLGENIDLVVRALTAAAAGALAAYVAALGASALASARSMLAARAQAAEELRLAQAHAATTATTLAHARANAGLTGTFASLTAAENAHATALARVAAAQGAVKASSVTLLGVLGGPVGVIALVASAAAGLYLFSDSAESAKLPTDALAESVASLGGELLKLREIQFADRLGELEKLADQLKRNVEWSEEYERQGGKSAGSAAFKKRLQEERAELERVRSEIDAALKKRAEIAAELGKRATVPGSVDAPERPRDPDAERRLKDLRDELELAKLTGEARAKLQAIQKLGANATKEQREEAEKLATQIFRLEEAQKTKVKSTKEDNKESARNAEVIRDLNEALTQAAISGEDLAVAKARAKLNSAATPEEIAEVERLGREYYRASEGAQLLADLELQLATRRQQYQRGLDAFGQGASARDLNAELARVEDAYQSLINQRRASSKGLTDKELGQIRDAQATELQMVRDHYAAMKEVQADWSLGAVDAVRNYVDEASNLYAQVGNAVSGAFQSMEDALVNFVRTGKMDFRELANSIIADLIRIQVRQQMVGIISSLGSAFGGGATSTGGYGSTGLINTQSSVSVLGQSVTLPVAGNRANGGSVEAGGLYRINERGSPEILNTNGKQYLMMNQSRGQVTPLGSTGSGSKAAAPSVVVNVTTPPGMRVESQTNTHQEVDKAVINVILRDVSSNGPATQAFGRTFGIQRKPR